jgi:hypothetical protein
MKKTTSETTEQTHAEFLASLREAHADARPVSFFRQWPTAYLIEAGLPQDWLEKCGLIHDGGKLPSQCSQRKFAEIVTKLFNKPINQAAVSRAIHSEGLKVAVMPGNGRLKVDVALRWWEENKAGKGGSAVATEAEEKAARQRIAREREEVELAEIKRRQQFQTGEVIPLATAKSVITGCASQVAGFYDRLIEDRNGVRKIVGDAGTRIGILPELLSRLDFELASDLQKANDSVKVEIGRLAAEADKKFDDIKNEQIRNELSK